MGKGEDPAVKYDPIEKLMDKSVEVMTASDLVTYMKTYLEARYSIELAVDGIVERKTLESFQKRYGKAKAGRIVQHVLFHHGGRKDGKYVTPTLFNMKMKWWTDEMDFEMQKARQKAEGRVADQARVESGFASLTDI